MLIRAADEDDTDAVGELNASVQVLHYEHRPDWFVPPDTAAITTWLRSALQRDDAFVLVAEDANRIVGYALATLHRRPATPFTRALSILEMDQVGVLEDVRRSGVASLLIRRVRELGSDVHADFTMLTVWDFNHVARRTFQSRGFIDALHRIELAQSS